MDEAAIEAAAAAIAGARLTRSRLARLAQLVTLEDGYRAQQLANARLEAALGRRIGHKIGGTTEPMRAYIGVPEPVAGEVFVTTVHASGAELPFAGFVRPGIETEIAVRLGRDLPPRPGPYTRDEAAEAVAEVMAAIEIVDDRYEDFRSLGAPTMIADNAFNAASVLGPARADWRGLDLAKLRARTLIDGREVATGTSDALMGHPLEALRWLAERRSSLGLGLAAGSFVSLGSITPVQWLDGPAEARIEVEGLGEVRVRLG
jgi:2-keto-4-pentenoate hydratase